MVGAARSADALAKLTARGIADAVVTLATKRDDAAADIAALKEASNGGFDVVLDLVCGPPMLAALKATRWGARIVTVGTSAGRQVQFDVADLLFRSLSTIGTGQRPPADRQAIWRRLIEMDGAERIAIDYADYRFDEAAAAWGRRWPDRMRR